MVASCGWWFLFVMIGQPDTGKTLLARWLGTIQPALMSAVGLEMS